MWIKKIGIDLGTTNSLVYVPRRGIVINEPSVVAVSAIDKKVLAVGIEAKEMLGRTPDTIIAVRPMKDGVIADYKTTAAMLRYYVNKALGGVRLFRPEVMVAVPAGITSTERRAVIDATIAAGAKAAYIIKEPIVAAIGADIPIGSPSGHMIIDIGGGTTEIAVISLAGIVFSRSIRIGGDELDESIIEHLKKTYNLMIGERTAEDIKIKVGSAYPLEEELTMEVRGRDLVAGLPKTITISSEEIREAVAGPISAILEATRMTLERTPPELSADLIERGIILAGGGSLLRGIDKLISEETGLPVHVAEDPMTAVAIGTGKVLSEIKYLKKVTVRSRLDF